MDDIEEVNGADLRVGDVIVTQAIGVKVDRLIRMTEEANEGAGPFRIWALHGAGERKIFDDSPVLRLTDVE
jgi:hypothetical protein